MRNLRSRKIIRTVGFDDVNHRDDPDGAPVNIAGVICAETRFEGMLWGEVTKNGFDATDALAELFTPSKFADQVHLILLDGITMAGSNVVELPELARRVNLPVVAVMRRPPDLIRFRQVLERLPDFEDRWRRVEAAGAIHEHSGFVFQVSGAEPDAIGPVLARLTDNGKVPEALRVAHLIGSAVSFGQSGKRA